MSGERRPERRNTATLARTVDLGADHRMSEANPDYA